MAKPKQIATIITEYRRHSHADVIVGKIIEGYAYDGGVKPDLQVVSMYVDQFNAKDMSRDLAKKHGFKICETIEEALTLGKNTLAVEGVVCIGEHGTYPKNDKEQIQYPRRRFFEEVTKVFAKHKKVVPVFSDKHLAYNWADAKWMYDRSRELGVPFLAGSSIPVTWRRPNLVLPKGCDLKEVVQIGYGPVEGYSFHALEGLQCMAERRKGGETGVKAVQWLQGDEMWKALDQRKWSPQLLHSAMSMVPSHATGDYRTITSKAKDSGVLLIEYRDGLKAAMALLNGWVYEGDGGAFCFAGQVAGGQPQGTQFYLQQPDPFGHFIYLVKAIESLIQTGHAPYPVERTLLTTGMLDAAMTSRADEGKHLETPQLAIAYQPTNWPPATDPVPPIIKR